MINFQLVQLVKKRAANFPRTKLGFKLKKKLKNSPSCAYALRKTFLFGHFTLLFCRGRQRNVPKFITHVQSDCFCSLNAVFQRSRCRRRRRCLSFLLPLLDTLYLKPVQQYPEFLPFCISTVCAIVGRMLESQ